MVLEIRLFLSSQRRKLVDKGRQGCIFIEQRYLVEVYMGFRYSGYQGFQVYGFWVLEGKGEVVCRGVIYLDFIFICVSNFNRGFQIRQVVLGLQIRLVLVIISLGCYIGWGQSCVFGGFFDFTDRFCSIILWGGWGRFGMAYSVELALGMNCY